MPAAIWTLLDYLGYIAIAVGIIGLIFGSPKGRSRMGQMLANYIGGAIDAALEVIAPLTPALTGVLTGFSKGVEDAGPLLSGTLEPMFAKLARDQFSRVENALTAAGVSDPDTAAALAADALGLCYGQGAASAGVTALFESIFPEKLNTLNGAGPIFSQMAGFEEVSKAVRDPLYKAAFGQSLEYYYRSKFKPELPSERDAVTWHSRGLLSDDQLRTIFNFSGLKSEYEAAFIESAYRPVSPFILERAASTGALPDADLRDALTFNGLRPVDIERMIAALADVAVDPYRKEALAAFTAAAVRGLYSGPDIDTELDALAVPAPARPYLKKAIAYKRLETLADLYRKSISDGYKYGQVSDSEYIPLLENAGLNQADAAAHYSIDSIVMRGKAEETAAKAEAKLAAERMRADTDAAMMDYARGVTDAAGLTLALTAAGNDPGVAAALVGLAVARRNADLQYVFGLELQRDKAILLREKVAAVQEDVVKKAMPSQAALDTLKSFGIPEANAEALVAKWAAEAYKQVLTP